MAHRKFDLVQETSTSTGTGNMALGGAVTRRRAFSSVLSNADTAYVLIENAAAAEWEICLATYVSAGNQLSRATPLASSTGSAVSFSAGTKTISMVAPAGASLGAVGSNTWAGIGAAAALTTGLYNTAYGAGALAAMTSDTYSDAFGYGALATATGHANAAFGAGAGGTVTTGYDNVFVGADAGRNADGSGDLTGINNTCVGIHAGGHITSGRFNSFLGSYSGVGGGAYIGAPSALLTGDGNTGVGYFSLANIQGAALENVAVGFNAGSGVTTGTQNICIGSYSGRYTTTGTLNITIGRDVQTSSATASNELNIGNLLKGIGLTQGGAASSGVLGICTLPVSATSKLQVSGDVSLFGNSGYFSNLYYSSGWKYHANGYGWLINSNGSGRLQITTAPNNAGGAAAAATVTARVIIDQVDGHVLAGSDNAQTLGGASNRWSVVYAGTGAINTSGRDSKVGIREPSAAERAAARRILDAGPKLYRFKDAVDAKGEAARLHAGYIAEDVRDALEAEGLDPWAYGFMCADPVMTTETYTETVTRPKVAKVEATERAVEMIDGRAVMVTRTVEREEPVGRMVPVYDQDGAPVMVTGEGEPDEAGRPPMVPMLHFVQDTETVEETRTREVPLLDTAGNPVMRLGLRYSELEAFLKCAAAAE